MIDPQRMVGIVGGTFDPIHYGHLRMALEVANQHTLDEVRFIPSAKPPHRSEPDATDLQRLNMVELAIMSEERFVLDDREYRREGDSFMVDTLESLRDELGENVSLILILGSDAFLGLPNWHQWKKLLTLAHIAVVLRPDRSNALNVENDITGEDLVLKKLYDSHHSDDLNDLKKNPCGSIFTVETTALEISASNIRKMVAAGESPQFLLPETVLNFIYEHNLYLMNSEEIRDVVVEALEDLKGSEIKILDVRGKTSVTDILVIASGNSSRQVKALANHVNEVVKKRGIKPLSMEGSQDSGWTLIDLGDVVVHVMQPETRDFYNLEKLWGDDAPTDDDSEADLTR
ncbi:MAG: nicotinate-nucleotide adenylyltransferase [Chromatiales bacterium]|nr:nicotinate-nucleotide adenylyltransferase [Chromatiales bacterium]